MRFWEDLREKIILKFFLYELKRRKNKFGNNADFVPPPVSGVEADFRRLVENAQDVIWRWDIKLGCTYISPNVNEHIGYKPEEVLGKTPSDFVSPLDAAKLFQAIMTSIEKGKGVRNFQCNLIHKDGHFITTEASTNPILDEKGDIIGFYGVNRDVTERRKAKDLSDALNDINSAINSTLNSDEIMHRVADESLKAVSSDVCLIILKEGDDWLVRYRSGMVEQPIDDVLCRNSSLFKQLISEEPIYLNTEQETALAASIADDLGKSSILFAPLTARSEVTGAMAFIWFDKILNPATYEVDFYKKLCASVSMSLENSKLYSEQKNISDVLQESFLFVPKTISSITFGYEYRSASASSLVGGDFIDLFEMKNGKVGIMVGDISGKGLLAANLTALVKNSIKAFCVDEESPAEILNRTNKAVLAARHTHMFATVFFAILDTATGELTYCCAGHPPAIVKRKSLDTFCIHANSPSVGAFDKAAYNDGTVNLEKGDILIIYTDGITEARHREDFFGEKRLLRFIRDINSDITPFNVCNIPKLIYNKVLDYTGGKTSDDIAVLAVSRSDD